MRLNICLDDELVEKLDERARKMHVTRSAFIAFSVSQKIQSDTLIENLPALAKTADGSGHFIVESDH